MVVRDHTVTKEGDLHEMGSRIKEDVHGEVMFLQLSSIHLLPLLSQKVRKREREGILGRKNTSMCKGLREYKIKSGRLDSVI